MKDDIYPPLYNCHYCGWLNTHWETMQKHRNQCPASPFKCKTCQDEFWVTDASPCPHCNADGAKEFPYG